MDEYSYRLDYYKTPIPSISNENTYELRKRREQ